MKQDKSPNRSISCTVSNCAHHCQAQSYCSLNAIRVGNTGPQVTDCASTECDSFQRGENC